MKPQKLIATIMAPLLALFSCSDLTTEPMPDIPETVEYDTIKINYGGDDLLGNPGARSQMLVGEPSLLAALTQTVVKGTNRLIRDQLQFVGNITQQTPTTFDDDVWIWEYSNADGYFYFQIEEPQASSYRYLFRAGKSEEVAEEILSGEFVKRPRFEGRQQGSGKIRFFFDAYKKLDPGSPDGVMIIAFRAGPSARQVRVGLYDFRPPDKSTPESGEYGYVQLGDAGRFKFSALTDWLDDGEPFERTTLDVAWTSKQEGRAAVNLSNGSLMASEVLLNECWDATSTTVYADATPDLPNYDDGELSACAPVLRALNLAPPEYAPLSGEPEIPDPIE